MRQACICVLGALFIALTGLFSTAWTQTEEAAAGDSLVQALSRKIEHLKMRLDALETQQRASQLEALRKKAESFLAAPTQKPAKPRVFKGKQRALQALNPEISVTGDYLASYTPRASSAPFLHSLRVLGLHIESDLDPFSMMKAAVEITPEGIELGEAYATWSAVLPGLAITAGKFRQQFGILNRWHEHSLDQIALPLPLTEVFGDEGLVQTGLSLDWNMPSFSPFTQFLTVQITHATNHRLFSGITGARPVWLVHLKNYVDLNRSTYAELGLSGLYNRSRYSANGSASPWRNTVILGADFTLLWEPPREAKYKHFLWRTEFLRLQKEWQTAQKITVYGVYTYIQRRFSSRTEAGLRLDWTQPFTPANRGKHTYQLVPYLTWWQSPWVRLRIEFRHTGGNTAQHKDNAVCIQVTWAAGPHKHERY
jgi:hypothetical protein